LFAQSTSNNEDIFNAIVDSGSSYSATNKFTDAKPDTIRRLEEPLRLKGIAGGLLIEHVGIAEWETLDKNGNIMSFQNKSSFTRIFLTDYSAQKPSHPETETEAPSEMLKAIAESITTKLNGTRMDATFSPWTSTPVSCLG